MAKRVKSAAERKAEYIAEQEALNRLGRSQSGVRFPPKPSFWKTFADVMSTGYKPSVSATPGKGLRPPPGGWPEKAQTTLPPAPGGGRGDDGEVPPVPHGQPASRPARPQGPRQTPAQLGAGFGNTLTEFLDSLPADTPVANSAAVKVNNDTPGMAQLIDAAAARVDPATGNVHGYDPALDNWRLSGGKTKLAYGETQQEYDERAKYMSDPEYARRQDEAEGQAAWARSMAADPGQLRRAAITALDAEGATANYNQRVKLSHKERVKNMNITDFKNYGDAFQHAQLNGMGMSEALKFASDWKKMNDIQGQQGTTTSSLKSAAGAPTSKDNTEQAADTQASVKRIREVAAEAKAAVAARQGGKGTAPAAAAAGAPKQPPTRDIVREGRVLDNDAKKRQVMKDRLNTIMTENKIKDEAMAEVLGDVFADDPDGKRYEAFQALKPMQKQALLARWKEAWLAKRKKGQADG